MPVAYNCVQVIVVRDGSAIVSSAFGERPVGIGDVLLLGSNVLCGGEPEREVELTLICLDVEFALDQFFWQYAHLLRDRSEARGFADSVYSDLAQVLRIGEDRTLSLLPLLDELVSLSMTGGFVAHFHRMQALWFYVADVLAPFVEASPVRSSSGQREGERDPRPRFVPVRREVRQVADLLRDSPERPWKLDELARATHLSVSQLCKLFTDTHAMTPLAYQTTLRIERLAALLRDTDLPIEKAIHRVGWKSHSHAARLFRTRTGTTPAQYRQRHRRQNTVREK
ncbi:AraC family transcriptional regulator [Nesterenkonia sp. CL21]|uniref:helix-turn-helix transcriptional regulator n=1 Tax=Nesterenkonia sp. CL21 TaxID=3064894 RepID=UPI002878C6DC|nr:AraC family transcriptional regulator [Nesterenkonia sp. CL21]MDS2171840.1 AraC family transcriptional regulator [Nesterenkonia sp. CL21]